MNCSKCHKPMDWRYEGKEYGCYRCSVFISPYMGPRESHWHDTTHSQPDPHSWIAIFRDGQVTAFKTDSLGINAKVYPLWCPLPPVPERDRAYEAFNQWRALDNYSYRELEEACHAAAAWARQEAGK